MLLRWNYDDPMHNVDQGAASKTAAVLPLLICPVGPDPPKPYRDDGRTGVRAGQLRRKWRHKIVFPYQFHGRRHISHHRRGIGAGKWSTPRPAARTSPTA